MRGSGVAIQPPLLRQNSILVCNIGVEIKSGNRLPTPALVPPYPFFGFVAHLFFKDFVAPAGELDHGGPAVAIGRWIERSPDDQAMAPLGSALGKGRHDRYTAADGQGGRGDGGPGRPAEERHGDRRGQEVLVDEEGQDAASAKDLD